MITRQRRTEMRRQAAKNPGNYGFQTWLYPDIEDITQGRNSVEKMREHYSKPATKSIVASAAPSSPSGPSGDFTPKAAVSAIGEGGSVKKKKKEKRQGLGAGISGQGATTSVLGSANISRPLLLGG